MHTPFIDIQGLILPEFLCVLAAEKLLVILGYNFPQIAIREKHTAYSLIRAARSQKIIISHPPPFTLLTNNFHF